MKIEQKNDILNQIAGYRNLGTKIILAERGLRSYDEQSDQLGKQLTSLGEYALPLHQNMRKDQSEEMPTLGHIVKTVVVESLTYKTVGPKELSEIPYIKGIKEEEVLTTLKTLQDYPSTILTSLIDTSQKLEIGRYAISGKEFNSMFENTFSKLERSPITEVIHALKADIDKAREHPVAQSVEPITDLLVNSVFLTYQAESEHKALSSFKSQLIAGAQQLHTYIKDEIPELNGLPPKPPTLIEKLRKKFTMGDIPKSSNPLDRFGK